MRPITQRIKKTAPLLCLLIWLAGHCAAEGKYFQNQLTLPDFPGFEVFVQKVDDNKAKGMAEARWSLSDKPDNQTKNILLVSPKKNLWITVSLLQTPYGGKKPLSIKKFEDEFVTRVAGTKATLGNKATLKSKYAGNVGYYYLTDSTKKYGTRLLYVPGADNGNYGDKIAFAIGVTHTAASADQAKALLQKILDNVRVSKK
jgi:hypothetical protein